MSEMGHLENNVLKVNPRDSAGDLSGYSFHMADAGTDAMEREKAFLFASSEGRAADGDRRRAAPAVPRRVRHAARSASKPIARARLEAMPYARLCLSCKEKEETAGRPLAQAPVSESVLVRCWSRIAAAGRSRSTSGPSAGPSTTWRAGRRCRVIGELVRLTYTRNSGVAFGARRRAPVPVLACSR